MNYNVSSGMVLNFDGRQVKLQKCIGEGAYSYVHEAVDIASKKNFAVKEISTESRKNLQIIKAEVETLKLCSSSPYILRFFGSELANNKCYLLLEMCKISLYEYIDKNFDSPFSDKDLSKIIGQTTKAIVFMHSLEPPLINRDLKVENLLITPGGYIRLCDFGSVTKEIIFPSKLSHTEKRIKEEEIATHTTPIYRPPEVYNMYLGFTIDEKVDIWALGCIYYYVCFFVHPFQNDSKLAVLSGNYKRLESKSEFVNSKIMPIIDTLLVQDPTSRPSAKNILSKLEDETNSIGASIDSPLEQFIEQNQNLKGAKKPLTTLSTVKSKAGIFLESLKETAKSFTAQINPNPPNIKKKNLPFNQFTSRIAISECPVYLKADSNSQDQKSSGQVLSQYLADTYPSAYAVINLINATSYPISMFRNRVVTCNMKVEEAPPLLELLEILMRAARYLHVNSRRMILLHCKDGGYLSHYIACLLLTYSGAVLSFQDTFCNILYDKPEIRISPAHSSFIRYAGYVERFCNNPGYKFKMLPLHLTHLVISPIFVCNKTKTLCRPFVSVTVNGTPVFSTISRSTNLREYRPKDKTMQFLLGIPVAGDVRINVYHVSKINKTLVQKRIFSVQFHTTFVDVEEPLSFTGPDLDVSSTSLYEILKDSSVTIGVSQGYDSNIRNTDYSKVSYVPTSPNLCFSSQVEYDTAMQGYSNAETKTNAILERLKSQPLVDGKESIVKEEALEKEKDLSSKESSRPSSQVVSDPSTLEEKVEPNMKAPEKVQDLLDMFDQAIEGNYVRNENITTNTDGQFSLLSNVNSDDVQDLSRTNQLVNFDSMRGFEETLVDQKTSVKSPDDIISFSNKDLLHTKSADSFLLDLDRGSSLDALWDLPSSKKNTELTFATVDLSSQAHRPLLRSVSGNKDGHIGVKNLPVHRSSHLMNTGKDQTMGQRGSTEVISQATKNVPSPQSSSNIFGPPRSARASHRDPVKVTASKPANVDPFGDILFSQGFSSSSNTSVAPPQRKTTMDEAIRLQEEELDQNPVKRRIKNWSFGKKKNIRALLSTLHMVLWPTDKWLPVSLAQMGDADQIKRLYRKACLCVHPDKHTGTPNEELARAIFCELNESWQAFESSGSIVFN